MLFLYPVFLPVRGLMCMNLSVPPSPSACPRTTHCSRTDLEAHLARHCEWPSPVRTLHTYRVGHASARVWELPLKLWGSISPSGHRSNGLGTRRASCASGSAAVISAE